MENKDGVESQAAVDQRYSIRRKSAVLTAAVSEIEV